LEPRLGVCIVGSSALQIACDQRGVEGPHPADLDLSWALDLPEGESILRQRGVFLDTTAANRGRGTLAMKLAGTRLEITSFRGSPASEPNLRDQILADLSERDMTVGALAYAVSAGEVFDPFQGLDDWVRHRVVAVGDPADRIREHPIRWARYYRRAQQWGFDLDAAIREVSLDPSIISAAPAEHLASELREALAHCASPGKFLLELYECGLLDEIAPELATQFDGRPAGPIQHHPEVSQSLHMTLTLEWYVTHATGLDEQAKNRLGVAVLCHDLGKGVTPPAEWPAHHGHEDLGVKPIRSLLKRLPGLTDAAGRRLAEAVCRLHLIARQIPDLRAGTRARIYGRYFRDKAFDAKLFSLAVGADSGGRLGRAKHGEEIAAQVEGHIAWIRQRCEAVDAGELWEKHKGDKERFQADLHQAWARSLSGSPGEVS